MALSSLSQSKTFVNQLEALHMFLCEPRGAVIAEDTSHSVAAPVCSFNFSLLSGNLNQSYQWDWVC